MHISPIPEIIADIKAGKMVVITDAEDRENEGDIIMAAQFVTPQAINFMIKHARGLVSMQRTWVQRRRREPSENRRVPSAAEPVMSAPTRP